jgi:hypothetical protein
MPKTRAIGSGPRGIWARTRRNSPISRWNERVQKLGLARMLKDMAPRSLLERSRIFQGKRSEQGQPPMILLTTRAV